MRVASALVCAVLVLSACGSDDDTTTHVPTTTAPTVPSVGQELSDALDSHLGEDWETSVAGALDDASSQVEADAFLVGTWWAVADYCVSFTSKDSGECHDRAAAYLVNRLGMDPQFETSHFAGAGAIGSVMDLGYDGTASYLDLPSATGQMDQGRPGF